MTYRPLSPWKREKSGSSRDREYEMQTSINLDTPFMPAPPFPCYTQVVCTTGELSSEEFPAFIVTDQGDNLVDDNGNTIVAEGPES